LAGLGFEKVLAAFRTVAFLAFPAEVRARENLEAKCLENF